MDPVFVDLLRPFLPFLGDREITSETRLRDFGLDSMQSIELLFSLEDSFDVRLPEDVLTEETFKTAGSLWGATAAALDGARGAVGET
ncbi:acyl carrier protein [Amycolatopsis bartoniae]|uniref:Carrier domain-containing protein n=1 Tax=Amycolatopsis bartoniae TaxID=941986 RepID=A0A8H9IRB8_9PSEU|nr:phosphopantetheine-binding protein [Amycolatopsis bartoniae]MBB2934279.1 acyl carrier protein [Amycolatopsis bartoniae]TVT08478.1 acyl carrier protein [Amycolatopsis bartoniae]GHF48545.1 hypothetical protein GCM10017566_22330 [Amycolatopsis bartoniae]